MGFRRRQVLSETVGLGTPSYKPCYDYTDTYYKLICKTPLPKLFRLKNPKPSNKLSRTLTIIPSTTFWLATRFGWDRYPIHGHKDNGLAILLSQGSQGSSYSARLFRAFLGFRSASSMVSLGSDELL